MINLQSLISINNVSGLKKRDWIITHTYATRNPSDKSANITLSWWNLVMTSSDWGTAWKSARSSIGKSSWKWYWEVTVWATGADFIIGVATTWANINSYLWADAMWRWYYSNSGSSAKVNNDVFDASYPASDWVYINGDVISVLLDMDDWTLKFYRNGVDKLTAYSWLTGTIYAMSSLYLDESTYTTNFWASAFTYSVPWWYNSWLYS